MPADRNIPNLATPLVRLRVTAILTDVWFIDAWTSCSGFHWMTFYFTYVQAAADGAVEFYLLFRPGEITPGAGLALGYPMSAYDVGPVIAGADTASLVQRERVTYTSTAAGAEGFTWGPIEIRGTVEDFCVAMREIGVPGTPGQFGIEVQMAV